jgi:hypothetical protein
MTGYTQSQQSMAEPGSIRFSSAKIDDDWKP